MIPIKVRRRLLWLSLTNLLPPPSPKPHLGKVFFLTGLKPSPSSSGVERMCSSSDPCKCIALSVLIYENVIYMQILFLADALLPTHRKTRPHLQLEAARERVEFAFSNENCRARIGIVAGIVIRLRKNASAGSSLIALKSPRTN